MKPDTYSIKQKSAGNGRGVRVTVYRHTIHYPRGIVATNARSVAQAQDWVARSKAEDALNRVGKVLTYLVERSHRVPAPVEPDNQTTFGF